MTDNVYIITNDVVSVHREQDVASEQVSQLLYGEQFVVDAVTGDWCAGRCAHDQYPGNVLRAGLVSSAIIATHKLTVAAAHAFTSASIKSPVVHQLFLGSRLAVADISGDFARLADGSFVRATLLAPLEQFATDWVQTAGYFLATPYLWGGRSRAGLDCSGLVQVALMAAGESCPRDTVDQRQLGEAVDPEQYQRGDLIFFPGHVGIMWDDKQLLHANAFHMQTVIEPLADVLARLSLHYSEPLVAARRLR